jgi:hypothetical protein
MDYSEKISSDIGALPVRTHGSSKVFYCGIVLYLVSFFLPAVWSMDMDHFLPGWRCAFATLFVWMGSGRVVDGGYQLGVRLTISGALINLLAAAYIVLMMPSPRGPKARLAIAVALLACMPLMWLSVYFLGASPYVGHAAWIVGLLLMICGDIRLLGHKRLLRITVAISSFVLALVSHGFSISSDPLASGPTLWGFTAERNRFSGEPLFLDLFRGLAPKTHANPISVCLSLLIDCVIWFVVLVAVSKLAQKIRGKRLKQANT